VNCPGCRRDNHAARRYCGGCGCNFEPACTGCGFANERTDRFCGGCGEPLRAVAPHPRPGVAANAAHGAAVTAAPAVIVAPAVIAAPATASTVWEASELAELFAPPPAPEETHDLPEVGINQENLDDLFGGAS
jgi:hypothetical protein